METKQVVEKKKIVLDKSLKAEEIKGVDIAEFNKKLLRKNTHETVRDCISTDIRHNNYLEYLALCWKNHYGVVFTPDFVWQIVLAEFATFIKDSGDNYRHLFTTSDEKQEISIQTADAQLIDIEEIARRLGELVPTDTKLFIPTFTTTNYPATLAFCATFADAMSPFYNYSMYMCGIPKVKVKGSVQDWHTMIQNLVKLKELFNSKFIDKYVDNVAHLISDIVIKLGLEDAKFWKDMFRLDRCGSGGQVEVKGWFTKLYMKTPSPAYINNYPTSVAYVPYKNLTTGKKYELVYGLFSSEIKKGYLVPEFGYIINEVK